MSGFLGLLAVVLFFAGCIGFFRPIKSLKITTKLRASGVVLLSLLIGVVVGAIKDINRANELGYASVTEMHAAEKAERDAAAAEAAAAKEEAERAEAAAKEEAQRAEEARIAAEKAETNRKGFHCLSAWDGSMPALERYVEDNLRDPDSYEHIETRIAPVSADGMHTVIMKYRARNGFGGMTIGYASGEITNKGCQLISATIE